MGNIIAVVTTVALLASGAYFYVNSVLSKIELDLAAWPGYNGL